jgi:hypothetical protein
LPVEYFTIIRLNKQQRTDKLKNEIFKKKERKQKMIFANKSHTETLVRCVVKPTQKD